jgi:hypothetical protein
MAGLAFGEARPMRLEELLNDQGFVPAPGRQKRARDDRRINYLLRCNINCGTLV